jgi:hypothetical protein
MAGRFHGDEGVGGRAEQAQELQIPLGILGEGRRLEQHGLCPVDHRHHMPAAAPTAKLQMQRPTGCVSCDVPASNAA